MPFLLGLTGQTGAGKTTVSAVFAAHGFAVLNADMIAREVVKVGSPCLEAIVQRFGAGLLQQDGSLHRRATAALIFGDAQAKADYEAIIFPYITQAVTQQIEQLAAQGYDRVLLDAPTLFESGLADACDFVVSVVADESLRLARIMQRDGLSGEAAKGRMAAQHTETFFRTHADAVLVNDGTVEALRQQAEALVARLPVR